MLAKSTSAFAILYVKRKKATSIYPPKMRGFMLDYLQYGTDRSNKSIAGAGYSYERIRVRPDGLMHPVWGSTMPVRGAQI